MATAKALIAEVRRIVQDSSYGDSTILGFLNQAINEVAGDPRVLLNDLEDQEDVTTSTTLSYVALPSDYQKNLFRCYNASKYWPVKVYASLDALYNMFTRLDTGGAIDGVTVVGANLHYQRIPSATETLQLHFYREPTDMDALSDTPDGIPSHLQKPLLVNYAAMEIYSEIEQDIQGKKVNTAYYQVKFAEAMVKLIGFIGPVATKPIHIGEEICWGAYS